MEILQQAAIQVKDLHVPPLDVARKIYVVDFRKTTEGSGMSFLAILQKAAFKIAREGPMNAARYAFRAVFTTRVPVGTEFDELYGVDTAGNDPLWRYRITSRNAVFGNTYTPCNEGDFLRALSMIEEDFSTLTFIDIGCGKGKTLLLASELGFKHLVGVEFVRELVEAARANLRTKNIRNGTMLHADAAEYEFPNSDCVVYLYNPFDRQVLTKVIANLAKLMHCKLYVVYCNPRLEADFDQCGFLVPVASASGLFITRIWRATRETG